MVGRLSLEVDGDPLETMLLLKFSKSIFRR